MSGIIVLMTSAVSCQESSPADADVKERGRQMIAIVESAMKAPDGTPFPLENAWPLLLKAISELEASTPPNSTEDDEVPMDQEVLYSTVTEREWVEKGKDLAAMRVKAKEFVAAADRNGVFRTLAEFAECKRVVRPAQDGELIAWLMGDIGKARALHRTSMARMRLAIDERDWPKVVESVEASMALGRAYTYQPAMIAYLAGVAIRGDAARRLRVEMLEQRFPTEVLLAIDEALLRQSDFAPLSHAIETERCIALDVVRMVYDDTTKKPHQVIAELRGEKISTTEAAKVAAKWPLATKKQSIALMNQMYDKLVDIGRLPAGRTMQAAKEFDDWVDDAIPQKHVVVGMMVPVITKAVQSGVQTELQIVGTRVMMALERYRAAHTEYPGELKDLVPAYLDTLPSDPYGEGVLRYKRFKGEDGSSRFLLYSVGVDGVDNGGKFDAEYIWAAFYWKGEGLDYVVNLPRKLN